MLNPTKPKQAGPSIEWPTWLLIVAVHGAWLALLLFYRALPAGLGQVGLVLVAAWHLSLQHELLHGEDKTAAHFVYWFSWFWSAVSALYFFAVTFIPMPKDSQHFADIILGFLLGLGAGDKFVDRGEDNALIGLLHELG